MDHLLLEKEVIERLQGKCSRKFVYNRRSLEDCAKEGFNPVFGFKLTKRFMTAMDMPADVLQYFDHITNFEDTKDSLLFLLIATILLYLGTFCLFLLPLLLAVKILYNSTTKESYGERKLDFQHSYGAIQRIMRIVSDMVELYDTFMKHYIFWGTKEKTIQLLIELIKCSMAGLIVHFLIPFNY